MPLILVIEDETPIRDNLKRFLALEGYSVLDASNGAIGLAMVREHKPDLILCDVMMPEMTGFEVLQHVRRDIPLAGIPFIFITASAEKESISHGLELGAMDYVTKPFVLTELAALIRKRLEAEP